MRCVRECELYALLGALAFWSPGLALHAIRGTELSGGDVGVLTIASLALASISLLLLANWQENRSGLRLIVFCQLVGIWALGPVWMLMSASFSGGGSSQAMTWRSLGTLLLFFPLTTPLMATYDGSVLALCLSILVLPVVAMLTEARQGAH
jgi:hypothetical protein